MNSSKNNKDAHIILKLNKYNGSIPMTKINEIYRCNICDNMVEIVNTGKGKLVCCNQPMELLTERKTDIGPEKHVPIVEKTDEGIIVKVGEINHNGGKKIKYTYTAKEGELADNLLFVKK